MIKKYFSSTLILMFLLESFPGFAMNNKYCKNPQEKFKDKYNHRFENKNEILESRTGMNAKKRDADNENSFLNL